ncbi:hypothetical protein SOP86_26350 [Pseudomonas canadensis]|nr:hypothetical protein [Pseudomonas canadensis]MEB2649162.1 hypothetical protein [Pseudomonas canadensis]
MKGSKKGVIDPRMFHRCRDRWNHQDLQSSISSGETITHWDTIKNLAI